VVALHDPSSRGWVDLRVKPSSSSTGREEKRNKNAWQGEGNRKEYGHGEDKTEGKRWHDIYEEAEDNMTGTEND